MATPIEQIKNEIIARKESNPNLDGLNSSSGTAIWRLLVDLVATTYYILESFFDIFKNEINEKIATNRLGTADWYVTSALEYQVGFTLNEFGKYDVIDEDARLVKKASFKESNTGELTLKVAKQSGLVLEPLSPAEVLQFKNYIDFIKFAGTKINIVSLNADELTMNANIYYEGLFAENTILENVKTAITNYLNTLSFDGVISKNELIEKVREVEGVNEITFTNLNIKSGTEYFPLNFRIELPSGYAVFSEALSSFNLIAE